MINAVYLAIAPQKRRTYQRAIFMATAAYVKLSSSYSTVADYNVLAPA